MFRLLKCNRETIENENLKLMKNKGPESSLNRFRFKIIFTVVNRLNLLVKLISDRIEQNSYW